MTPLSTTAATLQTWTAGTNHSMEYTHSYGFIFIQLLFSFFGSIGNGIVLWFLSIRIKRSPFTVYILNLALADMIFLLGLFIFKLILLLHPVFQVLSFLQKNANKLFILAVMGVFAYNSSLYLLTSISIERCLSVLYPIWYRCHRPKHQSMIVCAVLWMLSCLVTLAEYTLCDRRLYFSAVKGFILSPKSECQTVYILVCILSFLIFTPLMVLSNLVLLIKIWRSSWRRHSSKLYIVIVATVVLFLLFALPMRVLLLLTYEQRTFPSPIAFDISTLLGSINSAADPYVYFFVGSQGQKSGLSLRVMLQRVFREEAEPVQHAVETPAANITETEV
ncbi:proto-oncogene Mas-like [Microcaecilia unicolor]|uniref:Proto-oncogene Mas-like n=1 Tax=Microcaecilia unicolor TaxID=1415580 RepID=A0A6P7WVD5_9AMPH|nr:proto-oncogene Mas-like [Microcaecilia unicolor]